MSFSRVIVKKAGAKDEEKKEFASYDEWHMHSMLCVEYAMYIEKRATDLCLLRSMFAMIMNSCQIRIPYI